jgi:hypothetical protein
LAPFAPGLRIYRVGRMETLFQRLARSCSRRLASPGPRRGIGWLVLFGFLLLLPGTRGQTAAGLRVTAIERLPSNQVRLSFEDAGTSGILNYAPAHAFNLEPGATNYLDLRARIEDLGGGRYQTVIPDPALPQAFFRIAGFLPPDSDGDGLSDALEALIGTDPSRADTDGDGFGDGVETANLTDPLSVLSQPPLPVLPEVNFVESLSVTNEGAGTYRVPITISERFNGTIRYEIAAASTAHAGTDFQPVSGTLLVNGTNAAIPIMFIDDWLIQDVRVIYLDLKADSAGRYRRGGRLRHIIRLEDNDGYWAGMFKNVLTYTNQSGVRTNVAGFSELSFRLKLLRQGAAAQASLISTNPPGGRPQGAGLVPTGEWPMQSFVLGTNWLNTISGPIPVPASGLFPNAQLQRVFTLTAYPTNQLAFDFQGGRIVGEFTERLLAVDAGSQHLARNVSHGLFVLVREPQAPSPIPEE